MDSVEVLQARHIFPRGEDFHVANPTIRADATQTHRHDGFLEFFYVQSGVLLHDFNRQQMELPAGTLFWMRERDAHRLRAKQERCRIINIAFPLKVGEAVLHYLGLNNPQTLLIGPGKALQRLLTSAEAELVRTLDGYFTGNGYDACALRVVLAQVCGLLAPHMLDRTIAPELPEWLARLCQKLEELEYFMQPVTELPALAHKSPEHLARSFRKYLQTTPTEYLNRCRLAYAARLLTQEENRSILEIALATGFEQVGYFHRSFKRVYGLTPRHYRLKARQIVAPRIA